MKILKTVTIELNSDEILNEINNDIILNYMENQGLLSYETFTDNDYKYLADAFWHGDFNIKLFLKILGEDGIKELKKYL